MRYVFETTNFTVQFTVTFKTVIIFNEIGNILEFTGKYHIITWKYKVEKSLHVYHIPPKTLNRTVYKNTHRKLHIRTTFNILVVTKKNNNFIILKNIWI